MYDNLEDIVYSENVVGFNALVMDYLNMLDNVMLMSQYQFIDRSHRLLPLIYLKAIVLPDVEPIMPDMIEKSVTREEWEAVDQTITKKLGHHNNYQEVLDALMTDNNEMTSLSEGFTDIFQDLKDYISQYNMGTAELMNDAIWECKRNFAEYWGQRLVNLLRILHYLLYTSGSLSNNDALSYDDFDLEKRIKRDLSSED